MMAPGQMHVRRSNLSNHPIFHCTIAQALLMIRRSSSNAAIAYGTLPITNLAQTQAYFKLISDGVSGGNIIEPLSEMIRILSSPVPSCLLHLLANNVLSTHGKKKPC